MKFRPTFYVSKWGDWHLLDNVISLITLIYNWFSPDASHVEMWLPCGSGFDYLPIPMSKSLGSIPRWEFGGTMITSTMRGKANGVVMRPADKILKNPDRWFYFELECTEQQYNDMMTLAELLVSTNKGYAKRTLLKFIGINWPDPKRYICSQVVYMLLVEAGVFKDEGLIPSPRRMAKMLVDAGHEPKKLT